MSNVGAWDAHYEGMEAPLAYGSSSYALVAREVVGCDVVADWGCGGGALRAFLRPEQEYVGIDGSKSPFATVRADLVEYRKPSCAVVLRHVLEHNDRWLAVLDNAIAAALHRLVIVLFTPLVEETRVMFREAEYGHVPVIAFRLGDITEMLPCADDARVTLDTIVSPDTVFGTETVIVVER